MIIEKVSSYIVGIILLAASAISFASSSSSASGFSTLIQAENYTSMSGVIKEVTSDIGGGLKVSSIASGDWISYYGIGVNIPTSGSYKITYRIVGNGSFKFKESLQTGNTVYANVSIPTGINQIWTDVTSTISLAAGVHHFDIQGQSGVFFLNWFKIDSIASSSSSSAQSSSQASSSSAANNVTLIGAADFSDGFTRPTAFYQDSWWWSGAQEGGSISVVDGYYHAYYPVPWGSTYTYLSFYPPANTWEFYISFRARLTNAHSVKFFKIHGQERAVTRNYSNTTYGLAGGGSLQQVSFGDGISETGDVGQVINLDGADKAWTGRNFGNGATASILTPQNHAFEAFADGNWHTVKIHHKFNSGTSSSNEIADGVMYLEIDGVVYVNATGMFNRNPANPAIDRIVFGDWAQGNDYSFSIDYDDIRITTGGFE